MIEKSSLLTKIRIWKPGYFTGSYFFKKITPNTPINNINLCKSFLIPIPLIKKRIHPELGLISIETRETYASLCPEGIMILKKHMVQQNFFSDSNEILEKQLKSKAPDYVVDLYTLNVDNIQQMLYEYGTNHFLKKYLAVDSYSGIAYDLLIAGGIKKLVPTTGLVREHIVAVPNNFALLVLEAHTNEQAILNSTVKPGNNTNRPSNKP